VGLFFCKCERCFVNVRDIDKVIVFEPCVIQDIKLTKIVMILLVAMRPLC
jgi:hypothetical protein